MIALLCTLERRLACLSGTHQPALRTALLPFDSGETDDGDVAHSSSLGARGLGDIDDELASLRTLIALADRARQRWTKYRIVERLVNRTAEAAIVFTEYRDTLRDIASRLSALTSVDRATTTASTAASAACMWMTSGRGRAATAAQSSSTVMA